MAENFTKGRESATRKTRANAMLTTFKPNNYNFELLESDKKKFVTIQQFAELAGKSYATIITLKSYHKEKFPQRLQTKLRENERYRYCLYELKKFMNSRGSYRKKPKKVVTPENRERFDNNLAKLFFLRPRAIYDNN